MRKCLIALLMALLINLGFVHVAPAEEMDGRGMAMIDLEGYLYDQVTPILTGWDAPSIYAVSFYVYSNEACTFRGYENLSEFNISYNREEDCDFAPLISEERWNYAFWRHDDENEKEIIIPVEGNEAMETLYRWYEQQGIENLGFEDHKLDYDENMNYIGKGPVGYLELLTAVSNVALRIQREGLLKEKFGKPIPIIVHDLEYPWYVKEATRNANPNGEADSFLRWVEGF